MAREALAVETRASSLWHLKGFDLFAGMSEDELAEIDRRSKKLRLKRGQILFMPGDRAEGVFALRAGLVRLSALDEQGREATVALLEPGDVFGEAIEAGERSLVATAHLPCELSVVPRAAFVALMELKPDFALRVSMRLGRRVHEFQSKITCLLFKGAHSRLSELLLSLAERYGDPCPEGTRIRYRFSHRELASLIGVSRETVTHTLRDFRHQGLVANAGGYLVVREASGLERIV
jgi:CRP/FNR family cyclic AMP-dependent transcriptional regulator